MRSIVMCLMVSLAVLVCASTVISATIHVPADQPTIQAGINAAVNGDTVLVAPGEYQEQLSYGGKDVVVRSGQGPLVTVLNGFTSGDPLTPTVLFSGGETNFATLAGFTLRGGSIAIRASVSSSPMIVQNICTDQTYSGWAAVVIEGSAHIRNNTICHGANGGIATYSSETIIENNIVALNSNYGIASGGGNPILRYNDVYGQPNNYFSIPDIGLAPMTLNPLFVNDAGRDFRLSSNSPCVDAGNPDTAYLDPDLSRNDIGAIPLYGTTGMIYPICYNFEARPSYGGSNVYSTAPEFSWVFLDTGNTGQVFYEVQVGIDNEWSVAEMWATGQIQSSDSAVGYAGNQLLDKSSYYVRARVSNGVGWSEWIERFFRVWLSGGVTVPGDFSSIQEAINAVADGDTVLVQEGTYNETISFMGKSIVVKSMSGPLVTTIFGSASNDPTDPTVLFSGGESPATVLEGFTFIGGPIALRCGQGSSPTIRSNIFVSQTYSGWAALVIEGPANIVNNTILKGANGGIATYSNSAKIENNIIAFCSNYGIASGAGSPILSYNNVYGQFANYQGITDPGPPSLSSDPLFVDSYAGDYRLRSGSPCIDAGNPTESYNDTDGTRNDMGAVPFLEPPEEPVLQEIGAQNTSEGLHLGLRISATDDNGTFPSLAVEPLPRGATFIDSANGHGQFEWSPDYLQAGDYFLTFVATDGVLADSELVHISVQNTPQAPIVYMSVIDSAFEFQNIVNRAPLFEWFYDDPEELGQRFFEIGIGTDNDWQFSEMWNPATFESSVQKGLYTGSLLEDGVTYYYRLRASNGLVWSAWTGGSFRMNSVPAVPVLKAPINLAAVATSTPTLWLANATDAENDPLVYDFAGFHDTDCVAGPAINLTGVASGVDSTGGGIVDPLAENCRYWWRARSFDGFEYSDWSPYAQFMVNGSPEAPSSPTLDSPPLPDNKPVFTLLPTLSWLPSFDPDPGDSVRYKLELSVNASFSFVQTVDSLAATQWMVTDSLTFGTHYWWRVTARDRDGLSAVSGVKDFWTWKLGDVNHSHGIDLSDLSLLIAYLTQAPRPDISPKRVGDLTGDCRIDLSDLSLMISFLTAGGVEISIGCE